MAGCEAEGWCAGGLGSGGDGTGQLGGRVVDVGAEVVGMKQETQDAAFDVHATVRELCGGDKRDGVR